jgi:hypothetical protein
MEGTMKRSAARTATASEWVLVTGASQGIGEALAKRFARAGHHLVLVARSAGKLAAVASDLRRRCAVRAEVVAMDLAKPGAAARLADTLKRRRRVIDILVNNAGLIHVGRFDRLPASAHSEIVSLNVAAATDMLAQFVPPMVARGHGRVLNVASTSSFLPVPLMATYAASKAYLLSLTESLSEELKGTGVTVTALCPGVTATSMMERIARAYPIFTQAIGATVLDVDEVAEAGYDACLRAEVIRIPGRFNLLTTISGRALPKWLSRHVIGFVGRALDGSAD